MLHLETSEVPPDFKSVIYELKRKLAAGSMNQQQSTISNSAFATLQGTSHEKELKERKSTKDGEKNRRKRKGDAKTSEESKRRKRECPYGRGCTSGWAKCYYLTPSAAPPDFEPQPEVVNHIKDLREARPGLDKALRDHEKNMKKVSKNSSAGAAYYGSTF
ncbi:hypothetical protein K3495_g17246, partial [Podosphaera aphanis]